MQLMGSAVSGKVSPVVVTAVPITQDLGEKMAATNGVTGGSLQKHQSGF